MAAVSDTVMRTLVAAASLVVIVAGLRAASALLVPLAIAAFLAMISYPMVSWLRERGLPKWSAVALTLLAMLTTLLGPGLVVYSAAQEFASAVPRYQTRLTAMTSGWFSWLRDRGIEPSPVAELLNWNAILDLAGGVFANVALLLSNAFLVMLVAAFVLFEAAGFPERLRSALGAEATAGDRLRRFTGEVQRYLRVKTFVSLMTGLLVGAWLTLLDIDFAVLWGLLAFLLNFIPNFGSIAAAVPPVLLALMQAGAGRAAGVAAGFVFANITLGNLAEPYLMGRQLRISPLVVVVSLILWGWVWGPIGMVVAVPITMVVRILLEHSPGLQWVAVLMAGSWRAPAAATGPAVRQPATAQPGVAPENDAVGP